MEKIKKTRGKELMRKVVDIYLPLDSREEPNRIVWPVTKKQLKELTRVIEKCGWKACVLNPHKPVASVAEGMRTIEKARGERFINFMGGWAYPDFSVSPMAQLPEEVPKLLVGSAIPDFPGNVGLFAAASGLAQVGIETERVFIEEFSKHDTYEDDIASFLRDGKIKRHLPQTIDIAVTEAQREKARKVKDKLRGMIYGAVGPRSMQMWNKVSEADFLRYFGIAREGFDGLRLLKMAEKVSDKRAEKAMNFLIDKGMEIRLGKDPQRHLTKEMVIFQMKVYFALLELKEQFGLDFVGVQDQLDWIEHYPATDLTLGILNNKLRPEGEETTLVAATEADDGAAITMQVLKLLNGGEPVGFNDLRYWEPRKGLYWFVNSGALAPYFAYGSHDSLKGAWSERQPYMYFKQGGGTCSVVVRIPGVVTWARFSYRNYGLYLCAGRGVTDVPTENEWHKRSARCNPEWPHWYLKLCAKVEWKVNSNHPLTVCGDYLAELKALAEELDIPFECYDHLKPEDIPR
ncbi:MAG: L-fucose/L-arabinose isomerase family protein [Candidatus Aminicenantales bacterium]